MNSLVRNGVLNLIWTALLFITFFMFIGFFYSQNPQHQFYDLNTVEREIFGLAQNLSEVPSVYNSDLIQPYLIIQDALENWRSLQQWVYSPALYLFPDWPISLILVLLGIPNKLLPIFYAPLMLTGLSLLMGSLSAQLTGGYFWRGALTSSLLLLVCGFFVLFLPDTTLSYYLFAWISAPYIHSGAIACWLMGACIAVKIGRSPQPSLVGLFALACLVFLASISDFIFVVWFVAPMIGLFIFGLLIHKALPPWRVIAAIALPAVAAIMIETILRKQTLKSRAHNTGSIEIWLTDLYEFAVRGDYSMVLIVLLNAALLCRAAYLAFRIYKGMPVTRLMVFEVFLGLTCIFALVTPLLMNLYRGPSLWRYFLILIVLPPIWALPYTTTALTKLKLDKFIGAASIGALLIMNIFLYPKTMQTIRHLESATPLESCLLGQNLISGYSDYWNSKSLIFSSQRKIHLAQLQGSNPYRFNFNNDWFLKRSDLQHPFEPNFIILENLNADELHTQFGAPNLVFSCKDKIIWKYDKPLPKF